MTPAGRRPERGVTRAGELTRMPAAGRVCGQTAGPDWCEEPVWARGLCRRHYRRAARGLVLDPDDGRQVGVTPSGHGLWGVLTESGGRLLCHECGRWYVALGVHVGMRHGSVRDYRLTHGLTMSTPLAAPALSQRLAQAATDTGAARRLEPARSPDTLRLADPDTIDRGRRLRRAAGGR